MELKLYSREWCSWCIDAKEYLTEKGYRFDVIDVGQDRQAYAEMKELSDQTYVPTFVAGDRVLAEFVQHGVPRGGSTAVDVRTWSVTTRRDGAITRSELFLSRDDALEAAGLTE